MLSITKIKTTVLVASVALLCTSPLAAALKTRPRVNARTQLLIARARESLTRARLIPNLLAQACEDDAVASTRTGTQAAKFKASSFKVAAKPKFHGQQAIDEARTLEIQQALIREHYLDGEATGEWDQATRDASPASRTTITGRRRSFPTPVLSSNWALAPASRICSTRRVPPLRCRIRSSSNGGSN